MRFTDRADAGRQLAHRLSNAYRGRPGIVYALPRGGVVPGAEVARALGMPLDIVVVRKIGHPQNLEHAIGAVTETGDPIVNRAAIADVPNAWFEREVAAQQREARRRRSRYLDGGTPAPATSQVAIVVDDGVVTGAMIIAALRELQRQRPARLVVAVPVMPAMTVSRLAQEADEVVALRAPADFLGAVGAYYDDFRRVNDEEVVDILAKSALPAPAKGSASL